MKYVKQKLPGFKSGINYDDLETEIARLEKERQSAENEHTLVHGLETYLEPRIGTKRNSKPFGGILKKSHSNSDV
jgi:hypothetical protein